MDQNFFIAEISYFYYWKPENYMHGWMDGSWTAANVNTYAKVRFICQQNLTLLQNSAFLAEPCHINLGKVSALINHCYNDVLSLQIRAVDMMLGCVPISPITLSLKTYLPIWVGLDVFASVSHDAAGKFRSCSLHSSPQNILRGEF